MQLADAVATGDTDALDLGLEEPHGGRRPSRRRRIGAGLVVLVVVAGSLGWWLGRGGEAPDAGVAAAGTSDADQSELVFDERRTAPTRHAPESETEPTASTPTDDASEDGNVADDEGSGAGETTPGASNQSAGAATPGSDPPPTTALSPTSSAPAPMPRVVGGSVTPTSGRHGDEVTITWEVITPIPMSTTSYYLENAHMQNTTDLGDGCGPRTRIAGDERHGTYTMRCTITQQAAAGIYDVHVYAYWDAEGQVGGVDDVIGQLGVAEALPASPLLSAESVAPAAVPPGGTIDVAWRLRSDPGVSSTTVYFHHAGTGRALPSTPGCPQGSPASRTAGDAHDGTYRFTCTPASSAPAGTYRAFVSTQEANGSMTRIEVGVVEIRTR